jgi:hypothetical protein
VPFELPEELLAGPDVGGGFLFQLSRAAGPLGGFRFHLQEAGSDAAGPPPGSPELLHFAHPASPCMFGGPRCWEKRFALPIEATPRVRLAYNRTRFVIGAMLAQAAHRQPAPVEAAATELLERIERPLAERGLRWQIGGSAGAWMRGVPIEPADIDLGIETEGAFLLEELLEPYLVEPAHVERSGLGERFPVGAAFVGTFQAGMRVEWAGARADAPAGELPTEWSGPEWIERRERVDWKGHEVPLAPLEFELDRIARRGGGPRLEAVLDHLAGGAFDRDLLWVLDARAPWPPSARAQIEARLGPFEAPPGSAGATGDSARSRD